MYFQQELNYRGETISHLKDTALIYEKKVKELNDQIGGQTATITQLREELSVISKEQVQKPITEDKETETFDLKETQGEYKLLSVNTLIKKQKYYSDN